MGEEGGEGEREKRESRRKWIPDFDRSLKTISEMPTLELFKTIVRSLLQMSFLIRKNSDLEQDI